MRKVKSLFSFLLSLVVITLSVLILIAVSLVSLLFNGMLFILMISGLGIPMFGNMIAGKFSNSK
ncbi:MAG TPA: hypothetical protein VHO90_03940 [Bacteroidales bacterium]|nr:hypothetical protein [Bacteroidales bacterium]